MRWLSHVEGLSDGLPIGKNKLGYAYPWIGSQLGGAFFCLTPLTLKKKCRHCIHFELDILINFLREKYYFIRLTTSAAKVFLKILCKTLKYI